MIKAIAGVLLLGLGASLLLSLTNQYTHNKIHANKMLHQNELFRNLLTDHEIETPGTATLNSSNCSDWIVRKVTSPGYSGDIESLVLIQYRENDPQLSLRIMNHRETPGIGDFIDHQKDPWIKTLDNQLKQEWATIDMVSGATITTKAIRTIAAISLSSDGGQCALLD